MFVRLPSCPVLLLTRPFSLLFMNGGCYDIVINHLATNQTPDAVNYSAFPVPFNS